MKNLFRRFRRQHTEQQPKELALPPFDLRTPLVHLNQNDVLTLGDLCEGTATFGGIGSGKTSGSGAHMAKQLLKIGCGGVVTTVKKTRHNIG